MKRYNLLYSTRILLWRTNSERNDKQYSGIYFSENFGLQNIL
jgi:hypothetical protein